MSCSLGPADRFCSETAPDVRGLRMPSGEGSRCRCAPPCLSFLPSTRQAFSRPHSVPGVGDTHNADVDPHSGPWCLGVRAQGKNGCQGSRGRWAQRRKSSPAFVFAMAQQGPGARPGRMLVCTCLVCLSRSADDPKHRSVQGGRQSREGVLSSLGPRGTVSHLLSSRNGGTDMTY